jgi:predicted amidophosphoribosyltransferase
MDLVYLPDALIRKRHTHSQVGLSDMERKQNVEGAFWANPRLISGKSVLLMDDVATTGSTPAAASDSLVASGASKVFAFTLARALAHHGFNIA